MSPETKNDYTKIIEELPQSKLDFSNNTELKKEYNSEKNKIKQQTEADLALETVGTLQAVIFNMDRFGVQKGEKYFDEEIHKLLIGNKILHKKALHIIVKDPELTQELLNVLENTTNLTKRQQELKDLLWPLNNFYIRSAKLLGKNKLDKSDYKKIRNKMRSFSQEFENDYKKWEKNNPEKVKQEYKKIEDSKINYTQETKDDGLYLIRENGVIEAGNHDIKLEPGEKSIVERSYKALSNFVKFEKTLSRLGLYGVWRYRNKIMRTLNTKKITTGIDRTSDNYLGENEQILFLNFILKSLGQPSIETDDLEEYINLYTNKYSSGGVFKNNIKEKGFSKLDELFFKKFIKNGDFNEDLFIKEIEKQKETK